MKSKGPPKSPEQLIRELGIARPEDIDIEAIAYHCGVTVLYRPLTGCAARIIGHGDEAIITVDSKSSRQRQRFSAGHELGHWMRDRGTAAFGCHEEQFLKEWSAQNAETRANRFASDLLLPALLFTPLARARKTVDFGAVKALAEQFDTGLTATAIRLVELGTLPAVLAFYNGSRREWFVPNRNVPDRLWPSQVIEKDTCAYDLHRSGKVGELQGDVSSSAWFDHPIARHHSIHEHSLRTKSGMVLSLLWWKDEQMLIDVEEYEEDQAGRRSDHREDE